ncbi:MAG TPA: ABC transporter permease, partial [Halococcus sp.]|nr:ABC transporter permease [Halococcus sp.]
MATQSPQSRTTLGFDWLAVALVLGGILVLYYLVPMVSLFLSASPGEVFARIDNPVVADAAITSLKSATISTVVATVFGVPLAYWLSRAETRFSSVVLGVVVLPLVLPPTVAGIVLLTVFQPSAPLGQVLVAFGLEPTRSLTGIVLAQTFVASPFVVVTSKAAFDGVPRKLEHASRSLGKGLLMTFFRVTLPLAWPGIVAGITLTFARAMGEFGATTIMAYFPLTMPVQIYRAFVSFGL